MTQPGKSTFEICWYIESYLIVFEGQKEFDFHSVLNSIMRNLPFGTLYPASTFHNHGPKEEDDHEYQFLKSIVETFMNLKSIQVAKTYNLNVHARSSRHDNRKQAHLRGE